MDKHERERYDRKALATSLAKKVVFVPIENPFRARKRKPRFYDPAAPAEPPLLKAYDVLLDGARLGSVYQAYEGVNRKVGRLISSTRYVLRWSNQVDGVFPAAVTYLYYESTRERAVRDMLDRMLTAGCSVVEGRLVAPRAKKCKKGSA